LGALKKLATGSQTDVRAKLVSFNQTEMERS